eukprot:scaffold25436_cov127-Cylindrotheca_fusiformis.AAC.4
MFVNKLRGRNSFSATFHSRVGRCSGSVSRGYANQVVDMRSDTVTVPSNEMLQVVMGARLGDDVMGEDESVLELQEYVADLTGKQQALFVPTGTMANLAAILSHCNTRASEIVVGSTSHIALWEGGGAANIGGVHTRQITETIDARMEVDDIRDNVFPDTDDHCARTTLLCLENTQNMLGGVALPPSYMEEMGTLARELNIKSHVDGARIFNSAVAQNVSVKDLCKDIDSMSICFSKGLGAPVGSILVGEAEFIRLAKRARKRLGGGMRQAGVIASMCMFAIKYNVDRLEDDHKRARMIASELKRAGFRLPREGQVDTNIVYFGLPGTANLSTKDFQSKLEKTYHIKLTGGYSTGGELFRLVTHIGIDDEQTERAIEGIIDLSSGD